MGGGGFSRASRLLPLRGLKKVPSRRALRDTWGCTAVVIAVVVVVMVSER